MQKKEILTDTFTFEKLINCNGLYVDKTKYFHKLVNGAGSCYFCSRPRRFGKSLALSIFENIFLGRKELFAGLYIAETDYSWETFPVIHIDMADCECFSAESLAVAITKNLESIANYHDIKIDAATPGLYFNLLISALKEKTGKNVVILVDEYDKPLTDNIDDLENLEKVRKVLESFYQIIKAQEKNERFVFMTGITKFSKVGLFSKLNNLTDITMNRDYACMFGYTQEELEKNFAPYIDDYIAETNADRSKFVAKIKYWYDGFRFDYEAETVYNPVSIGQFFSRHCRFDNYWFATATPTPVVRLAKNCNLLQEDFDGSQVSVTSLNRFDIAKIADKNVPKSTITQLLLQTGYLTIDSSIEFEDRPTVLRLRFPNYEVRDSFEGSLFEAYTGMDSDDAIPYAADIAEAAEGSDVERMIELIKNFIAGVPYTIQNDNEKYYQSMIFCILKMCGMDIEAEQATNSGRVDAVLKTKKYIYIIEFKVDISAGEALEQIQQRKYFQKYIEDARRDEKQIVCIGINFSSEERNISEWKSETL